MSVDEEVDLSLDAVFREPTPPPPPEPTIATYTRELTKESAQTDWQDVKLRLVGTHPLWGHYLWNAARAFATYLDQNPGLYRDGSVLELGAGSGLPGIVAAKNGARQVVLTDYPDSDLINNLEYNVKENIPLVSEQHVCVKGYIWGRSVAPLLEVLPVTTRGFDLIILSDLIFNHSQHNALLDTCELVLSSSSSSVLPSDPAESDLAASIGTTSSMPNATVLVFYTHHRPHLSHRDMDFFTKARERGWKCEKILTRKFSPMFAVDSGDEEVRSTVHGWKLSRQIS